MIASHPAADLFPMMDAAALVDLAEDIRQHGLREPVVLHPDGRIIDGRNRYRACGMAGVEPRFRTWDGEGSLVGYVVSLNLHRRHLSDSQRAMVGARIRPMFEEEARARMLAGKPTDPRANLPEGDAGRSREQAAAAVQVSPRSVEHASKVLRDGATELVEAVERGEVAVSAAAAVAKLSQEEQREVVGRGREAVVEVAKQVRTEGPGAYLRPKLNTAALDRFIGAAIDAARAAANATDEQVDALTANEGRLDGLRRARDLADRIIRRHTRKSDGPQRAAKSRPTRKVDTPNRRSRTR